MERRDNLEVWLIRTILFLAQSPIFCRVCSYLAWSPWIGFQQLDVLFFDFQLSQPFQLHQVDENFEISQALSAPSARASAPTLKASVLKALEYGLGLLIEYMPDRRN